MNISMSVETVAHDHGHWCITCALSTGIRFVISTGLGDRLALQERLICVECGGNNIHVNPKPERCPR
jgi:hypothetical protein